MTNPNEPALPCNESNIAQQEEGPRMKPTLRIACCIPFCRRTAPREQFPTSDEIVCGKCWKFISKATKAARRRIDARLRKYDRRFMQEGGETGPRAATLHLLEDRLRRAWDRNWEACKRESTEGRAGIG